MTSPQTIYRTLTLRFARSVTFPDQIPRVMEVEVVPLDTASSAAANATFIEGPASQSVLLNAPENIVTFSLLPSDLAGLSERVLYRVAWRAGGITGRTYSYDFAMPDDDLDFEDLASLSDIIDGENYLRQSDLGVIGRVARLNNVGQVVDAFGIPVAGQSDITLVENDVSVERVVRQQADVALQNSLTAALDYQYNQAITSHNQAMAVEIAARTTSDSTEQAARIAADGAEQQARVLADEQEAQTRANADAALTTALTHKADLDTGGHIPIAQIPPQAITNWKLVDDQAAMLALVYPDDVQPGDVALVGDLSSPLIYALNGTDPSDLSDWVLLNKVTSVNGQTGDITVDLTGAADEGGEVPIDQVTGLSDALTSKADTSITSGLDQRVGSIEGDTTIVHTVGGVIPHELNDSTMAYVDDQNRVVKKDGTVITAGGSAVSAVNGQSGDVTLDLSDVSIEGGSVALDQVDGLSSELSGKVDTDDSRLSDPRTPTAHATSHGVGESDAVTVATSQVTGLPDILTNNGLTGSSNHENRIATLEIAGPGEGSVNPAKSLWFDGTGDFSNITNPADFQTVDNVQLKSPWSVNDSSGHYTYNADGVPGVGESYVYPYVTPMGHLQLRKWDETNDPDPELATTTALGDLASTVSNKADQSDLEALTSTVADKADQSALESLSSTVADKADQSDLTALSSTVSGKADQSDLTTLASTVSSKANQSDLTTLSSTVSNKADQSALNNTNSLVSAVQAVLPTKADLTNGRLSAGQIPTGIPQASVANLPTDLAAKADLSGGKLLVSQLPNEALVTATEVANRAAMLALTGVQKGDLAIITTTSDQGTYILVSTDPTQFANWKLLKGALPPVLNVNGQTGTVVLDAAAVGAMAANASIPQSQVTGLVSALAAKVDTSTYNAEMATKTSAADVQNILTGAIEVKQKVDYVSLANILSLSGQQSADGVLMALGSRVLLTAQSSSVYNGIWRVNSSAWTRETDMPSASWLVKGTIVVVGAGSTNSNTIWQSTSTSGTVDTAANNWVRIGYVAPPYAPSAGNGISITGTAPSQTITAVAATGGGCQVTSQGIGLDTTMVARKFVGTVPAGSTTPTITHNLNTNTIMVQVIEVASGAGVLLGWAATGVNTVQLEFSSIPASGQWKLMVIG